MVDGRRVKTFTEADMKRTTDIVEGKVHVSASQRELAFLRLALNERNAALGCIVAMAKDDENPRGHLVLNAGTIQAFLQSGGTLEQTASKDMKHLRLRATWEDPIARLRFYGTLGLKEHEIEDGGPVS